MHSVHQKSLKQSPFLAGQEEDIVNQCFLRANGYPVARGLFPTSLRPRPTILPESYPALVLGPNRTGGGRQTPTFHKCSRVVGRLQLRKNTNTEQLPLSGQGPGCQKPNKLPMATSTPQPTFHTNNFLSPVSSRWVTV